MSDNNNNSNHNKNKEAEETRRHLEELALFQRFRSVATARLEKMANMEETDVSYQMGDEEKRIITQMHGMGLKEGIFAGVATFVLLRKGPLWMGRYIVNRRRGGGAGPGSTTSGGGYQLSNPNNPFQQAASNNPNPIPNPHYPRSRNPFFRGIWFAFDTVLSLMMAANISLYYTDMQKIKQELTDLPLVPGKSLVSDALCPDLTAEWQKVVEEQNPAYRRLLAQNQDTPLGLYMNGIKHFCENCQRRAYREQELRQEQGLSSKDPVEIPHPGIPRDAPRLIQKPSENGQVDDGMSDLMGNDMNQFEDDINSFGDDDSMNDDTDWSSK
eukprot:scaffold3267_cov140-Cylindrotheca_fusiformis.AAC.10